MNKPAPQGKAFLLSCLAFLPDNPPKELGGRYSVIIPYICENCSNTHILFIDPETQLHELTTLSPIHAEQLAEALMNPQPLKDGYKIDPKNFDRIDCTEDQRKPKPKKEKPNG